MLQRQRFYERKRDCRLLPNPRFTRQDYVLLIAALLYCGLYLAYFPRSFSTADESNYLNMAYVIRRGTVYPDVAGMHPVSTFPVGPHMVSKYPPGMPALLAAVSLAGWRAALGTNLIVHLLTFWVLIGILKAVKIPPLFALLFLLHPTAVLYSRTIMADPASGLCVALMAAALLNRRFALCGLFAGLAVLLRMGNAIVLPAALVAPFFPSSDTDTWRWREALADRAALRERLNSSLRILLGAAIPVAPAAYYAIVIANGQMGRYTGAFSLSSVPGMLPFYLGALMVLYPGMLVAPFLYRGPYRIPLASICLGILLLYSLWYYRDQGSSAAESLVLGQRYFLACLPIWIMLYAFVVWQWMRSWNRRALGAVSTASIVALAGAAVAIHAKHDRYVSHIADVRDSLVRVAAPGDYVLCNTQIAKLFHPGLGTCDFDNLVGVYKENVAEYRNKIAARIRGGGHRAFIATWIRAGRPDDEGEVSQVAALESGFKAVTVDARARKGLPQEVTLVELRQPAASEAR